MQNGGCSEPCRLAEPVAPGEDVHYKCGVQTNGPLTNGALVDRDAERSRLEALLAGARAGEGGALVVCGESGAGKTALLAVARRRAEEEGMLVLAASGVEAESELAH